MSRLIRTESGKISSTKVWANVGCATATIIVLVMTYKDKMTWEIFLAYLGTVGGFSQISKWLSYRYGAKFNDTPTSTTDKETDFKCSDCPVKTGEQRGTDNLRASCASS